MRRYLLDSGIANDYLNFRRPVFDRAEVETLRGIRIGVGTPVLGELLAGVQGSATRIRNLRLLRQSLRA